MVRKFRKLKLNNMNKETRRFFWGLIVMFICLIGLAVHIVEIKDASWQCNVLNVLSFILTIYGIVYGAIYIYKSIE